MALLGAAELAVEPRRRRRPDLRQVLEEAADGRSFQTAAALAAAYGRTSRSSATTGRRSRRWCSRPGCRHSQPPRRTGVGPGDRRWPRDLTSTRAAPCGASHLARTQRIRPMLNHAIPWLAVGARLDLAAAHLALADPPARARCSRRSATSWCAGRSWVDSRRSGSAAGAPPGDAWRLAGRVDAHDRRAARPSAAVDAPLVPGRSRSACSSHGTRSSPRPCRSTASSTRPRAAKPSTVPSPGPDRSGRVAIERSADLFTLTG